MKQSESIAKLAVALVAVQADIRAVAKDSTNPHFKSKFASLDNIIAEVRPVLARHGLAVVQGGTTPESDAESHVTAITVETTLIHASGEWLSSAVVIPLAKADPQGAGAALTYGRRYSLSALLCLATDEDDDGNAASRQSGAKKDGRAANRSTAATTQPAATARSSVLLTRESRLPRFGGKYQEWRIAELPYDFLSWATDKARSATAFGADTDAWKRAFQDEVDGRAAGEVAKEDRPVLAGVS